jgi:hypothetical protein
MAKVVTLVHPQATLQVPAFLFVNKCDLFASDPGLAALPYHLNCGISLSDLGEFVSALDGKPVRISNSNFRGLSHLCDRFGFRALATQISEFRASEDFKKATEAQITIPIPIPMTEINHSGTLFADLFLFTSENAIFECTIGQAIALSPMVREQLSVDACARAFALNDAGAVDTVRHLLSGDAVSIEGLRNGLGRQLCSPVLEQALAGTDLFDLDSVDLSVFSVEALDEVLGLASFSIASEDALLERLLALGDEYHPLLSRIEFRFLNAIDLAILEERFTLPPEWLFYAIPDRLLPPPPSPPPSGWNCAIVPDFPKLFEDFKRSRVNLLWRGGRHGFRADEFHRRCDRHPNTLTVILDTDGNIFGGFTPVEWETLTPNRWTDHSSCWRADPSLRSFLFTLKNPHNVSARRFALKAEEKDRTISCDCYSGPHFSELVVFGDCDDASRGWTEFGTIYNNDTGLDGKTFFTGSAYFQVREIEVFEITD